MKFAESITTTGILPNHNDRYTGVKMDILRIILAIILPPVGVFMQVGFTKHFFINILLTLLGYIPGIIHALWIITTR
jgi:uncharacterized membrane protein YqaE (UPF0057 family)